MNDKTYICFINTKANYYAKTYVRLRIISKLINIINKQSQQYKTESGRDNGIASVGKNCSAETKDLTA